MSVFKALVNVITIWAMCTMMVLAQQGRGDRFERIESEKKSYITKQLNLSASESQKFLPLYQQYHTEMTSLQRARRQSATPQGNKLRSQSFNADKDILAYDAKKLELKKNYRKRFADVIGQARASQFFQVEEEFHEQLMRNLQNRKRD